MTTSHDAKNAEITLMIVGCVYFLTALMKVKPLHQYLAIVGFSINYKGNRDKNHDYHSQTRTVTHG